MAKKYTKDSVNLINSVMKMKASRLITIGVGSKKDKIVLQKAINILDKLGYTIAKKTDLILESET